MIARAMFQLVSIGIIASVLQGTASAQVLPTDPKPVWEYKMSEASWGPVLNTGVPVTGYPAPSSGVAQNGAFPSSGYGVFQNGASAPGGPNTLCTTSCQYIDGSNTDTGVAGVHGLVSIMAWVRWDIAPGQGAPSATFFSHSSSSTAGQFWLRHNATNTAFEFAIVTDNSPLLAVRTVNLTIQQGVWYHVTGVYRKDNGFYGDGTGTTGRGMHIYVNAVLNNSVDPAGPIVAHDPARTINVGRQPTTTLTSAAQAPFTGSIDEPRIFTSPLTQPMILRYMNAVTAANTPVILERVSAVANGIDVELVDVAGPTVLELWREDGNGAFRFTGVAAPVDRAGTVQLRDPSPSRGTTAKYFLVDRSPGGVTAVYDGTGALSEDEAGRRGWRVAQRGVQRRPAASSPIGVENSRAKHPPPSSGPMYVAEIPGDGSADGIAVLPDYVDGRAVIGAIVDGQRYEAFGCGTARVCVLVPPQDPWSDRAFRRSVVLETSDHGQARPPRASGLAYGGGSEEGRTGGPVSLVTRRPLLQKYYLVGWPTYLERMLHVGLVWPVANELVPLRTEARNGEGDLRSVRVDLRAYNDAPGVMHPARLVSGGNVLADVSFVGPNADTTVSFPPGSGINAVDLRAGSAANAMDATVVLSRGVVEHQRHAVLIEGRLLAEVTEPGTLAVNADGPLLLIEEGDVSGPSARILGSGQSIWLASRGTMAVATLADLEARVPLSPVAVDLPKNAEGADLVIIDGTALAHSVRSRDALRPWLDARSHQVERAVVVSLAALRGAYGDIDDRDAVTHFAQALAAARPADRLLTIVLVGSATADPSVDIDIQSGVRVPTGLTPTRGWTAASDAALIVAEDGEPLPGVAVARWPVATLEALASMASGFARAAALESPTIADELLISDPGAELRGSLAALQTAPLEAGVAVSVIDGRIAGASAARTAILSAFGSGRDVVWYVGHGSHYGLGKFLRAPHLNGVVPPVTDPGTIFIGLTCFVGSTTPPNDAAIFSRRMFTGPDFPVRGAVIGSGILDVQAHERFGVYLADAMFTSATTLGEAWLTARDDSLGEGLDRGMVDAFVLLGDPLAATGTSH